MTELPNGYVPVLDKGYVGVDDHMGNDFKAARAARVSFAKNSEAYTDEQNTKLLNYLLKKEEYSPFRHSMMTFEVRMPIMVARQMWKYVVASNWTEDQLGWNENSRRYITDANEFYIPAPDQWRSAPDNKKQGSAEPVDIEVGKRYTALLMQQVERGDELYNEAMEDGIAPELARVFLHGYSLYVTCYWTASLPAILHVIDERIDHGAQKEIQEYAKVLRDFFGEYFPLTLAAWEEFRSGN